jgi:reductive dehalogenase
MFSLSGSMEGALFHEFSGVNMVLGWMLWLFALASLWFAVESAREGEWRAVGWGAAGVVVIAVVAMAVMLYPELEIPLQTGIFIATLLALALLAIPARRNLSSCGERVEGAEVTRPDERETTFSRMRLDPEHEVTAARFREFYATHPTWQERDTRRRAKGLFGRPGRIDQSPVTTLALMAAHGLGESLMGDFPGASSPALSQVMGANIHQTPQEVARRVKAVAKHFGADLVGICRVDSSFVYSRRGSDDRARGFQWGDPIDAERLPPWAIVIGLEMDHEANAASPHLSNAVESMHIYSKGAHLTTTLAEWIRQLGFRAEAQHSARYDLVMPPLGVAAGLGEISRMGYLVAPGVGARVRLFAVLTDWPMEVDRPVSLGVEEFCWYCQKCAESCPSKAVPSGEKVECRGFRKWKIDADACFDYWAAVGTDCGVCMAICPFSRPDTWLHGVVRLLLRHSWVARRVFPHVDNWLYGRVWKSKPLPLWAREDSTRG